MDLSHSDPAAPDGPSIDDLLAEFACELEADPHVDPDEFVGRHPGVEGLRAAIEEVVELRAVLGRWRDQGDSYASAVTAELGRDQGAWSGFLEQLERRRGNDSRYEVRGRIAQGGFGDVFRVRDLDLRQTLAMKVLRNRAEPDKPLHVRDVDPRVLGWFLQEAQITAQLNHPAIVAVHELGLTERGEVFFTMKYVKGITFREGLKHVQDGAEGWTVTRALGVILKACDALAHAHQKGVIHRDVKPANIMIGGPGEVYMMDWGLARLMHEVDAFERPIGGVFGGPFESSVIATAREEFARESPQSPLLTSGVVPGTPMYMSPEQAAGRWGELGPHSDVFAMGAILYELLAGQAPYTNPDEFLPPMAIIARVADGPPKPIRTWNDHVPAELEAICEKAMSHTVAGRYPTMVELAEDLRAYLEGRVVRAYATGPIAEFKKWAKRNRRVAIWAAVALTLFVAVVTGLLAQIVFLRSTARIVQTAIDKAPAGILVFAENGDCLYGNERITSLLRIARADLLQQNCLNLSSWKKSGLDEAFRHAMVTDQQVSTVFDGETSHGDMVSFHALFVPMAEPDGTRRLLFFCNNLTDYAAAQSQLIGRAPLMVIDAETNRVVAATANVTTLLGRTDLVGSNAAGLLVPGPDVGTTTITNAVGDPVYASVMEVQVDGQTWKIVLILSDVD